MITWTFLRRLLLYPHLVLIAREDGRKGKIPGSLLKSLLYKEGILLLLESFIDRDPNVFPEAIGGFLAGGSAVFLIYLLTGKGIGAGDVKLLAVTGLCLGSRRILEVQMLSCVLASPVCLYVLLTKNREKRQRIPLVPFFLAGMLLADCIQGTG